MHATQTKRASWPTRPVTPGNSTVTVTAAFKGVKFMSGLWGEKTSTTTFRTGPAMVSYVDMQTDMMRVTKDGKLVKVIPITTGKTGFETRSGVKVIMTSGYNEQEVTQKFVGKGLAGFIQKPYKLSILREAIQKI